MVKKLLRCHICKATIPHYRKNTLDYKDSVPYLNCKPVCSKCFNEQRNWLLDKRLRDQRILKIKQMQISRF